MTTNSTTRDGKPIVFLGAERLGHRHRVQRYNVRDDFFNAQHVMPLHPDIRAQAILGFVTDENVIKRLSNDTVDPQTGRTMRMNIHQIFDSISSEINAGQVDADYVSDFAKLMVGQRGCVLPANVQTKTIGGMLRHLELALAEFAQPLTADR